MISANLRLLLLLYLLRSPADKCSSLIGSGSPQSGSHWNEIQEWVAPSPSSPGSSPAGRLFQGRSRDQMVLALEQQSVRV